jgi:hypothetical protein
VEEYAMPSREARRKWNAEHYLQFKLSAEKSLIAAFKDACAIEGSSASGVVRAFMQEYANGKRTPQAATQATQHRLSTRGDRRKGIAAAIATISQIREAEEAYLNNIPDNMQGGARFEAAAQTVAVLDDALDALQDAY